MNDVDVKEYLHTSAVSGKITYRGK